MNENWFQRLQCWEQILINIFINDQENKCAAPEWNLHLQSIKLFQVVKCYVSSEELQEDPMKVIVSLDKKVAKKL